MKEGFQVPGSVDVDSPNAKRRKETAQAAMPATTKSNNVASNPSAIKQDAVSPWPTRQGCDKQRVHFPLLSSLQPSSYSSRDRRGCLLSPAFMRLPSKRQYADYYQQIQNPVTPDEIKSRIETE